MMDGLSDRAQQLLERMAQSGQPQFAIGQMGEMGPRIITILEQLANRLDQSFKAIMGAPNRDADGDFRVTIGNVTLCLIPKDQDVPDAVLEELCVALRSYWESLGE